MAIDEADREELMVARDIRTTLNMILDQLRLSGPQKQTLTIAIDPATLTVLATIFGGDAAAKIAALTAQLKTESTTLETAVGTAQQPPMADKRP